MTNRVPPFVHSLAALTIALLPLDGRGQAASPQAVSSTGEVATFCDNPTRIVQVQRLTSSTEVVGMGPEGERWRHSLPQASSNSSPVYASIDGDAVVLATALAKGQAFLVASEGATAIEDGYLVSVDFANGHAMVATQDARDGGKATDRTRIRIYHTASGTVVSDQVIIDADSYDTWTLERHWFFRLGHDARHFYYIREGKELVVVEAASGLRRSLPLRETGGRALAQQVYDAVLVSPAAAFVATGMERLYHLDEGGLQSVPAPGSVGRVERLYYAPERQQIGVVGQTGWSVLSRRGTTWSPGESGTGLVWSPGESGTGLVRLKADAQGWLVTERGSPAPVRLFSGTEGKYRMSSQVDGVGRSANVACANRFGALLVEDGQLTWRAMR